MGSYRIVLADDHALFRDGIKHIIHEAPDLEVVGEVADGLALLDLLDRQAAAANMVLLDISMPKLRGLEASKEIKACHPGVKIIILTMHSKLRYIQNAFEAGVNGYLLKEATGDELFDAISCVRRGDSYVSTSLTEKLNSDMIQFFQGATKAPKEVLTTREKEVLKLVAEGKESKEIAKLLFISIYTVNNHRANIIRKLKMKKTADLVKYAMQEGYIFHEFD